MLRKMKIIHYPFDIKCTHSIDNFDSIRHLVLQYNDMKNNALIRSSIKAIVIQLPSTLKCLIAVPPNSFLENFSNPSAPIRTPLLLVMSKNFQNMFQIDALSKSFRLIAKFLCCLQHIVSSTMTIFSRRYTPDL